MNHTSSDGEVEVHRHVQVCAEIPCTLRIRDVYLSNESLSKATPLELNQSVKTLIRSICSIMADADEDVIPRTGPSAEDIDLSDETQDFRFLAALS